MSIRPMPETVATWALDEVRRAGAPHIAIVNAIVFGGACPGRPGPVPPEVAGGWDHSFRASLAIDDAIDRGFAIRHDDGSWEPTALGVLASWAFHHGFFSGP